MDNPSKRKLGATPTPETSTITSSNSPDKRRKVIGPSLPPPTQPDSNTNDSDDSDGDDFGPSLPPPEGSVPHQSSAQSTPHPLNTKKEEEENSAPKRDEWMLAPPTADSRSSRVDPTKLRNRKFQSGPRVGNTSSGSGVDSSWTETPEEKMRRLQDEAMGIVSSSSGPGAGGGGATGADDEAAQAMREKVQRYNERVRKSESMVEEKKRKEKGKEEKDDDPSKRAFDKEKDMALSSKLTHAQRREMVSKASDFGSRFSKGRFL
ncbi:hypothetical protein BDW59DRAFT_149914 [Aspergillus cavernicola]|uniref:DUF3752 domain-containing protein n=1 Tax=Aspergillus cavernicola TaxID=176166 RepID=A0ABR4I1U5_9EURO